MSSNQNDSVILFFIDGLGIGEKNESNPLHLYEALEPLAHFHGERMKIFAGGILIPTDACLGVDGRPQSASGQTTILTGINAPKILGNHKQGFPNQKLRDVISEHSIFLQLKQRNIGPNIFINTYTPQFFEKTPRWKSATTCAVEAAGIPFCKLPDLVGEKSLFHDFTNERLIERGLNVPVFSPKKAGEILAETSSRHRFSLYEHFITDKIGHDRDFQRAARHLPALAEFVRSTLETINLEKTTFILTSDHGNIEDLSIRNHTRNPVPTIIWGRDKHAASEKINDLSDITPTILDLLNE